MRRLVVRAGLAAVVCLLTLDAGVCAPRTGRLPMIGPAGKTMTLYCPEPVSVDYQAVSHLPPGAENWHTSLAQMMYFCPGAGTNISGGYLHCGYANKPGGCIGGEGPSLSLFLALDGRQCSVLPDKKGFSCTGP